MALGFIRKVFSFGKDRTEEVPAGAPLPEAPSAERPEDVAAQHESGADARVAGGAQPNAPEAEAQISATAGTALPESEPPKPGQASAEAVKEREAAGEEPSPEPAPNGPATLPLAPAASATARRVTVAEAVREGRIEAVEQAPFIPAGRATWFDRLRKGLSRSSEQLGQNISGIFTRRKLDDATLEELEDVLIQADLGMETAMRVTDALSKSRYGRDVDTEEVRRIMAAEVEKVLEPVARPLELDLSFRPHVILVVGVNGTGKTTTIGKLAAKLTSGGLKVTLAAGDTFRAAAIEQLHIWGERTGVEVVSTKLGADAAGLAFDAWEKARANGSDVLIIDTAGRLQNRAELMEELAKIVRVLGKHDPDAPHTVLQTLDATTGQNALSQVEIFRNVAGVNGLVMTKLDGTARGGILVAISAKHKLPVYFIGVGEGVDDLEPFSAKDFAGAIAGIA